MIRCKQSRVSEGHDDSYFIITFTQGTAYFFRVAVDSPLESVTLLLAVCIPKACTTEQAINEVLFNLTQVGLVYEDEFCRLPGDKRWVAADYVFM